MKWMEKRCGMWCPEDRLRVTSYPAFALVPLSVLSFGLSVWLVDGRLGLTLALMCLFINGLGVCQSLLFLVGVELNEN